MTIAGAAAEGEADAALPYGRLQAAYQAKLERALTPSGGPNGDEFCHADGSAVADRVRVLLDPGAAALVRAHGRGNGGDPAWADRMESLVLNVGMGARDPIEGGVAYLKTDDSLSMLGVEGFRPPSTEVAQTRYMYSPVHREAAVCCVPNAGRLLPTYLRYLWLRGVRDGRPQLVALLFAASTLRTAVDGVPVTVTQHADYPSESDLAFTLEVEGEADFTWSIRRPIWASEVAIAGVDASRITSEDGLLHLAGPWRGTTEVTVRLHAKPEIRTTADEALTAWGPLLFAQPIPGRREVARTTSQIWTAPPSETSWWTGSRTRSAIEPDQRGVADPCRAAAWLRGRGRPARLAAPGPLGHHRWWRSGADPRPDGRHRPCGASRSVPSEPTPPVR